MTSPACPLCRGSSLGLRAEVAGQAFLACGDCGLVHRERDAWPDAAAERSHYATHRNDPGDPGYRRWLARLADPLCARLPEGAEGLDYGCGPGPALAAMLVERGHRMAVWDPFFAPDRRALGRSYDFITCTEAVEHFHDPAAEFARIDRLLRPGGWLGLMTSIVAPDRDFATWRYARDPTHVCFYTERSLDWLAMRLGWSMQRPGPDVVLFRHAGDVPVPVPEGAL